MSLIKVTYITLLNLTQFSFFVGSLYLAIFLLDYKIKEKEYNRSIKVLRHFAKKKTLGNKSNGLTTLTKYEEGYLTLEREEDSSRMDFFRFLQKKNWKIYYDLVVRKRSYFDFWKEGLAFIVIWLIFLLILYLLS